MEVEGRVRAWPIIGCRVKQNLGYVVASTLLLLTAVRATFPGNSSVTHAGYQAHGTSLGACPVVLYTCYFGAGKMYAPPEELRGCAVAFTDRPQFVAKYLWAPMSLDLNTSELSVRRISRFAKIRSHIFFDAPSMYLDSKLQWPQYLKVAPFLQDTLFGCNASFVAYAHPKRSSDPMAEFAALEWHNKQGHARSGNLTEVFQQRERFRKDAAFQAHIKRGAARMIDGSLIIRRPTRALKAFEDAWWAAYLAGSDRDQPAFAHAMFTSGQVNVRCGNEMLILRQNRKTPLWAEIVKHQHPRRASGPIRNAKKKKGPRRASGPKRNAKKKGRAAKRAAAACCPGNLHRLPAVSCNDWLSSACFDGHRRIIYTNDTRVQAARHILLPTDYAANVSVEIRPVSSEHLATISQRQDTYGGSGRWLDGMHLLDTWRNAQSQDLSHIGHFLVSIGSLFSYSQLLKTCAPAASVCKGLLLFQTTHDGSPVVRKHGSWEAHTSWAKDMLPIVQSSANTETCGGGPAREFPHMTSLGVSVCSHNFLVEAAYADVYPIPADYERWRAQLTRHFGLLRPSQQAAEHAVLIVQRSHNRVIKNLPAVLFAAKQLCSTVRVAYLKDVDKWSPADQLRLYSRHTVFISTSGSHIANLIAAAKGSTWIELRNAGLRQGISKFPKAAGIRHRTYVNDRFNLTSGKWPGSPGDRKQCEREATEFRLGDSRRRIKATWPPCFMNWNLEVHIPKLERLLRSVLEA
jgi:hypothetical protein